MRDAKHKSRFSDQGQGCSGLAGSDTILKCRRLRIEAAFIFRVLTLRTLWGEANGELLIELRNDPQGSSCARWPGMLWVEGLGFMVLTWTPKVCKIMAFMAIIMGLGLLFYILLGFR